MRVDKNLHMVFNSLCLIYSSFVFPVCLFFLVSLLCLISTLADSKSQQSRFCDCGRKLALGREDEIAKVATTKRILHCFNSKCSNPKITELIALELCFLPVMSLILPLCILAQLHTKNYSAVAFLQFGWNRSSLVWSILMRAFEDRIEKQKDEVKKRLSICQIVLFHNHKNFSLMSVFVTRLKTRKQCKLSTSIP